jgi:hypothetical protein
VGTFLGLKGSRFRLPKASRREYACFYVLRETLKLALLPQIAPTRKRS